MSGPRHDPDLYRRRDIVPARRALLSVSDKSGLVDLAEALSAAGVELVSTGSTASTIRHAGLEVTDVSDVTGFAEALDGRVKTLHPAIHAGLLADLRLESHEAELADLGIRAFDLVVVNLYPFDRTVAAGASAADTIEQIDIGGPAMVRASAKNHANVAIIVSPAGYPEIVEAVASGGTSLALRRTLAARAFAHTAAYDASVASWFAAQLDSAETDGARTDSAETDGARTHGAESAADAASDALFPTRLDLGFDREEILRYGENSHQRAALYRSAGAGGIARARQRHGKEMSYNNYVDADAAVRAAFEFSSPAVAVIKHANPCGIAVAAPDAPDAIASAHERAHACDPVSAFGGVIAANRIVTAAMAETVSGIFTEVLIAPGFAPEALEILTAKRNIRLLELDSDDDRSADRDRVELRQIAGGLLVQEIDDHFADFDTWTLAAGTPANASTRADLEFAWRACRAVKSNAILLADAGASVGVGMGQVNRVDSCHLAVERAGPRAHGAIAASDAFFPFADGVQVLLDAGVRAIVQPGGSVRDAEVISAVEAAGATLYLTGERHFYH